MKAYSPVYLFGSIICLFALVNCGGGGSTPEPVADQQFTKLQKAWIFSSATLDGSPSSIDFTTGIPVTDPGPMKVTISGTKGTASTYAYAVVGRPAISPWPKSGKWEFGTNPSSQIIRDKGTVDELAMTYTVDASKLTVSFTFNNPNGGYQNPRMNVVGGNWVFVFTAQ
jgi:hypothetical protein